MNDERAYTCSDCGTEEWAGCPGNVQFDLPSGWRWLWGRVPGRGFGALAVCGDCPDPPDTERA